MVLLSVDQPGRLFAKALQDTRLRNQGGVDRHSQVTRHVRGGLALDNLSLEGDPGGLGEIAGDELHQLFNHKVVMFLFPGCSQYAILDHELVQRRIITNGKGYEYGVISTTSPAIVEYSMDHHGFEPTTKGPGAAVVLEIREALHQCREHLLRQVVAIGGRNASPGEPHLDQPPVKFHETIPVSLAPLASQAVKKTDGSLMGT